MTKIQTKIDLSKAENWRGVWTALVTPFKKNENKLVLDSVSLKKLIDSQIQNGVDGLVIAGSTGEGSLLGLSRYKELLQLSLEFIGGRVPVVAGLGIGGTESTLEHTHVAKECGVQGLLAAPPAYIKSPQRELVNHFIAVAEVGLPVCIYEIPGRAAQSILVSTLEQMVSHSNIASKNILATKDASGDLIRAIETKRRLGSRIAFLSGDDFTFLPFLAAGGDGIISVVSHVVPRAMKSIWTSFFDKKLSTCLDIQTGIHELIDHCFAESNPIPVKTFVKELNLIQEDHFLPPLGVMDSEKKIKAFSVLKKTRERFES